MTASEQDIEGECMGFNEAAELTPRNVDAEAKREWRRMVLQ